MKRLSVLLTMVCVTGAAATAALASPAPTSPSTPVARVAPATAKGVSAKVPARQPVRLNSFGAYNLRQGTWIFTLNPKDGC
jgi:hypothetical protein